MEYSIRKFEKRFYIECKVVKKTGFLLWVKDEVVWCKTNIFGGPNDNPHLSSKPFKSMKKAKKQIKKWDKTNGVGVQN